MNIPCKGVFIMSKKTKSESSFQGISLNILAILMASGLMFILPVLAENKSAVMDEYSEYEEDKTEDRFLAFHNNTLSPFHTFSDEEELVVVEEREYRVARIHRTTITAYSSTVDQTDCTPFITASGSWVEDGIVAANFLPFNTKIRIPEYFGDKVFVVKDRMNRRHNNRVDIWFSTRKEATNFGITQTDIEVLKEK